MKHELTEIIRSSWFEVIEDIFVYAKVASLPQAGNHFMVTQDRDEITVVTTKDQKNNLDVIEWNKKDYRLIAFHVSVPFYATGFLAVVAQAIADQNMNVLFVSTYSKDYVLVRQESIDEVIEVLISLGFQN